MKTIKFVRVVRMGWVLLLLASLGINNAWADRVYGGHRGYHNGSHTSIGFGFAFGPMWGPGYYGSPYYSPYYYPPAQTVIIERPPTVYIEQAEPQAAPAAAAANYWYYCPASKAYYPYVGECPSGWQRVSPQPPDQAQ